MHFLLDVDAETQAAEMEKEESWEQAKMVFANSLGKDATLVKDEMTNINICKRHHQLQCSF